jgi:hypothetical protein
MVARNFWHRLLVRHGHSIPIERPCRSCRAALGGSPTRQVITEDGPHPPVELVPSPPGSEPRRPRRPCPRRALSIGQQRSSTDNHGRCPCSPNCRSARPERSEGASQARGSSTQGRSAGDGDQFSRCRAPGHAASGWSHRARAAAPRRSISAARYSTIQAILGRSWIIHGVSRSPGAKSECVSCVSWVSRLPQVGHLGAGVVMHGSMVRAEVPVHLVRAGSARHREPLVLAGHER